MLVSKQNIWIWIIFECILVVSSIYLAVSYRFIYGAILFLLVNTISLWKGLIIIEQKHEVIVEFLGKYIGDPVKAGPHILSLGLKFLP